MIKYDIISADSEQGTLSVKYWDEDHLNDFIIKTINVPLIEGKVDDQALSLILSQHCEGVDRKLQIKRAPKVSLDHLVTAITNTLTEEHIESITEEAPKKKRKKTVKVEETE